MSGLCRRSRVANGRTVHGGARGRRAVARIEKLVAARANIERKLDQLIGQAVLRARARGVPWRRIAGALVAARRR